MHVSYNEWSLWVPMPSRQLILHIGWWPSLSIFLSIVLHIITILLRCKILFWWYNKIIIFCSNQILFPFCFISNPSSDTSLVNLAKPLPLVIHSNFSICRGYGVGTWKHFFYAENFSYYYCSLKNFQIHSQRTLRHCWNELNQFAA